MRKELFNAIKAKLASDVPEVQHIDLWNHNVEFVEQEEGWARPAVFVEFGKIEWSPFQGGSQRGKGLVTIHLVTDWADGGHDAASPFLMSNTDEPVKIRFRDGCMS